MFSYVMLGARDIEKSRQFYDSFFGVLGMGPGVANGERFFYIGEQGAFAIAQDQDGNAGPYGGIGTVGFSALSPNDVRAAYGAALAAGGSGEDAPNWQDGGIDGPLFMAYLRDPSGNRICIIHQPQGEAPADAA